MNNFTPRAQQVLALARKEADRFNHNYVGTEHLLLGLIKLGQGVASMSCRRWASISNRPHGGRETSRHRTGNEDGRQHSLHAAREKSARARRRRKPRRSIILTSAPNTFCSACCAKAKALPRACLKSLEVDIERTRNEILKELDPNFTPSEDETKRKSKSRLEVAAAPARRRTSRRPRSARLAAI